MKIATYEEWLQSNIREARDQLAINGEIDCPSCSHDDPFFYHYLDSISCTGDCFDPECPICYEVCGVCQGQEKLYYSTNHSLDRALAIAYSENRYIYEVLKGLASYAARNESVALKLKNITDEFDGFTVYSNHKSRFLYVEKEAV